MSRPIDPESGYRIKIYKYKGYRYASTQPAVSDPATGTKKYHRVHWGTVDDNNKLSLCHELSDGFCRENHRKRRALAVCTQGKPGQSGHRSTGGIQFI